MHLDRRTMIRSTVCSCLSVALSSRVVLCQAIQADELEVIATVLRAQCGKDGKHPVLIASDRFSTGRMTVLTTNPTPLQKAAHQVELPYLLTPSERMAEAEELAASYNKSLERYALPLPESAAFNFPYRLLDDHAVSQFEALYPGCNVYSEELEKKRRAVSSRYHLYFDGSTTVWKVSRVAFASGGALAVIGLRSSGGSCTSETWEVLERLQAAWHGLPWGEGVANCA